MGIVSKTLRWAAWLLTASLLFPFSNAQAIEPPPSLGLKPTGEESVSLSLKDLAGNKRDLSEFKDKIVIVHFWATWCAPCREELHSLDELQHLIPGDSLEVLAVAVDNHKAVSNFMEQHDFNFTVLIDQYGEAMHDFKVIGVPTSFIVDKEGRSLGQINGMRDWREPLIITYIKSVADLQ